ncbi:MAG: efflux RND transporter periplasmic adaptor subunit [Thermodesulfobacteriota bacterium]
MARIAANKRLIGALVVILLLVILIGYRVYQSRHAVKKAGITASEKESAFPVLVAKVIRGDLEELMYMAGTVVPRARVDVFSRVTGQLQEVRVKEGDRVKKDDLLAVVRGNDGDSVSIRSPISGIVEQRSCEPGDIAIAFDRINAKPLFAIADTEVVKVQVGVPETLTTFMKVGMEARVRFEAYPLDHFPLAIFKGTITSVSPTLDVSSRMARAEVTISNRDHSLKPGMFAMVGVVKDKLRDIVLVPKESLISGDESDLIFVLRDNIVHQLEVLGGASDGRWVQVLNPVGSRNPSASGEHTAYRPKGSVQEGDEVVTIGARMVYDGQRVKVIR